MKVKINFENSGVTKSQVHNLEDRLGRNLTIQERIVINSTYLKAIEDMIFKKIKLKFSDDKVLISK